MNETPRPRIIHGRWQSRYCKPQRFSSCGRIRITVKVPRSKSRTRMLRCRLQCPIDLLELRVATAFVEHIKHEHEGPAEAIVHALLYPELEAMTRKALASTIT